MELHDHPVRGQKNKFVVTEEEAYFFPVASDEDVPLFVDILAEVFNLNDPEVVRVLDEKFDGGKLILGYLEANGELDIHVQCGTERVRGEEVAGSFRG
ncbi:MAG: hypothetical protein CYG60_23670 [Actinobacteria bacterium]|nr:MAG: hypothetical protein CYG60_23670 [Actinomycetota bacterium]